MNAGRIQRLNLVLNHLGAAYSAVAIKSGISPSNLKNMLDGKQTITDKTMHRIYEAYPEFNIKWLKEGVEPMLSQQTQIEKEILSEDTDYVPLLPVEAMAGTLQGLSQGIELAGCQKIKSPVKGADWAIVISGDSMEPDYKNGSYLFIKKMSGSFIPWGHTLVLDTYDGVVVKDIYPVDDDDSYIEARSINPKYPPFRIEKSIIIGVYRVLGGTFINSTI